MALEMRINGGQDAGCYNRICTGHAEDVSTPSTNKERTMRLAPCAIIYSDSFTSSTAATAAAMATAVATASQFTKESEPISHHPPRQTQAALMETSCTAGETQTTTSARIRP